MLAAALFALAALSSPDASRVVDVRPDSGKVIAAPARKAGTLRTAARPVPVTLARFDEPALPFITYYTERAVSTLLERGPDGTRVSFNLTRDGQTATGAQAQFFFPAAPLTTEALSAATFGSKGALNAAGYAVSDAGVSPCLWADEGRLVRFSNQREGFVCVGSHQGQPFTLTVQAPSAAVSTWGAHVDVLLSELRWRENGAGLE